MAAYPGEGYKMSNYGLKTYTPEEMKEQWREIVEREHKCTTNHTSNRGASKVPEESSEISYFGNDKKYSKTPTYDRMFHMKEGYSSKLKRDDLEHTIGLNVHSEEVKKSVPVLSSSVYGHPQLQPLESTDRKYVRVATVKKEFYRPCGADATLKRQ